MKTILELMSTLALMSFEAALFFIFEWRFEKRWVMADKSVRAHSPSSEGRFWQNIISYDHKKGGEKD